jgi:hypothetical protein
MLRAVAEGSGVAVAGTAIDTPVKVVGQALPGPPAGVIVVVKVPSLHVQMPSPSSKLGLVQYSEGAGVVEAAAAEFSLSLRAGIMAAEDRRHTDSKEMSTD